MENNGHPVDRAAALAAVALSARASKERRTTTKSGTTYVYIPSTPMALIAAGYPAQIISPKLSDADRKAILASHAEKLQEDPVGAMKAIQIILRECLISPRLFIGHAADSPEGYVSFSSIEGDANELLGKVMGLNAEEGVETARAVERFPEDEGRLPVRGDVSGVEAGAGDSTGGGASQG